ncbi:aldo/keto reductase [Amycolatopsis cihanbeyliensis]|uniref:Aryl-alcohol dehydrogenase-like predicted oxidoreductase n=1 Tax=Amycolatopsis cihanbeyliensis TaxID=1128664 RepID=A0A542CSF8_AMYCI|nr:aldo/keto reductase [Amycolatopsis cihanbeyliensis]TQI93762.1 aryl-alcohol dehydrogenase-like predicted oxidoreductase [Amycolatopsis cihanbeyliensis]
MKVPHRKIGTAGPDVSVLSLGSWHTYDRMRFTDAVAMMRYAVDSGINFFDVGYYGGLVVDGKRVPESFTDVLFGQIMRAAGVPRENYLLSAKLWVNNYQEQSLSEQLDELLLRVGTEYADFAVLGDIAGLQPDLPRLVEDLGDLIARGKLGSWGVNNWSCTDIRSAHEAAMAAGVTGPQLAQLKYSVVRRSIADGTPFGELTRDIGLTLEASDVLEGGMLAGNLDPERMIGKDPGGIRGGIAGAAERLAEIARSFDATPAQAAVAFCLTHPATSTVLFGASRQEQLTENIEAVRLAQQHGAELRAAVDELWLDREAVDPEGPRSAAALNQS